MTGAAAALLAQGLAAHRAGNMTAAEEFYRAAVNADPAQADAAALLGVVLGARGEMEQAVQWVDKAIALDPESGLLHFQRGNVLMAAGRLEEAIVSLRWAQQKLPHVAEVSFNLANALRASGQWAAAIDNYREALRDNPLLLEAYNNLALSLIHEEKTEEAKDVIMDAVQRHPDYGDGWLTLCNVAEKAKAYETAMMAGHRATELMPQNHFAWFGLGVALNRMNRDEEAIGAYRQALSLKPDRVETLDNLAQTYQALNRLEEAETCFRLAVRVAGQEIPDEEKRAVAEEEYGKQHWHLALMELLRGKYKQGFARYRSRFVEIKELKRQKLPCPLWKGEDLTGKSLLVCDEQGYGDTLMLARFVPELRKRGVRVVFSVHKVLAPLFQNWDGADIVIVNETTPPPCDYFCSTFDLPHLMGTTLETLPNHVPYLPVLPPDAATQLPPSAPKVGVVWGGSPLHKNDHNRSVPLPVFCDLFTVPSVKFYSFNRDLKPGDAVMLPHYPIENLIPALTNFANASRLIGQMDVIITCDTATAHLAGGMGKKVRILLPFAPDWRWLTDRDDTPWYPTARLFRQPKAGDWASVITQVREELLRL